MYRILNMENNSIEKKKRKLIDVEEQISSSNIRKNSMDIFKQHIEEFETFKKMCSSPHEQHTL